MVGYRFGILVLLSLLVVAGVSLSFGSSHLNTSALASNSSDYLDPIINLSSSNNLITGLSVIGFLNGSTLSFTTVNGSQTLYSYLKVPKLAIISSAAYNITSQNFTGNIAYTPSVSTSSGGVCRQNHTSFSGYVLINGVNTSVSSQNFVGGLLSASGSCSASVSTSNSCGSPGSPYPASSCQSSTSYANPTCSVSLSCNPSTTCCTSETQSVSKSCPSGYSGGSCSSASSPSSASAVTGTTGYEYEGTSFTASEGTTTQCNGNPAVAYQSLTYTTEDGGQGSCSNTGSTSLTDCSGGGLPSCVDYETSTYGTQTSGYTFTCNYDISGVNDGCINLGLSMGSQTQCQTSGGCVITPPTNYDIGGYYGPGPSSSSQPSSFLGSGDSYTVPSDSDQTEYSCTISSFTIPYGDYYTETQVFNGCPTPKPLVYYDRVDYPYYNIYYDGTLSTGTTTGSISANGGICADQNTVSTVYTGPGSSSATSSCSATNSCASCSPSPVTYDCTGDYNSSTPNECLTSTSGKIVYSASCPSPGSGTISSVSAIPNSCVSSYNNTAVSNVTQKLDGTSIYSESKVSGTQKVNIDSALSSYMASCTANDGNCTVPISTSSDTPGVVKLVSLSIPFSYNVSGLYTKVYDAFNYTQQGLPITPGKVVGYGANISFSSAPYKTIAIHGFDSKIDCQMQIGSSIYRENVNGSGVCPFEVNITSSGFKSFDNSSVSRIYLFNKEVTPITQTFLHASQDTSEISTPGVAQYISVPVQVKSNASSYGVTQSLNTSILTTPVNGFAFNQSEKHYLIPNGTTNITLQYSGNLVTSKETTKKGNFTSWKQNKVVIEDIWNNTSPYNFTHLFKTYSLGAGTKVLQCLINGTEEINTTACKVVTNSTGTFVQVNWSLAAHKSLDPTITAEAPNITMTESGSSQTSSKITCYVPLGTASCSSQSDLDPSFSQTAYFTNSGQFTYPSINLSATIPAYNQTEKSTILVSLNGVVQSPYYIDLKTGVINWTTQNFTANTTETWKITYNGVPLKVEFTNESTLGKFEWNVVTTAPPGLVYNNFYFQMDTPITTSQYACTSTSLTVCTPPNVQSYLGQGLNINVIPSVTTQQLEIEVSQIPANGSIGFVPVGIVGKPISCSITESNQTSVVVGQVIQVTDIVTCSNPNTNKTQLGTLPFTYDFKLPSNAFGIIANQTTTNIFGLQPLVSTGLSFFQNYSYIPLSSVYNSSQSKRFTVKYKLQPLAITYKPINPQEFYTNLPALYLVNVSLSNDAPVTISNASYNIPIAYGFNASFVINNTVISNTSRIVGSYPVTFTDVPGNTVESGTIFYSTPTANITAYPGYATRPNATALAYFLPYAITSVSPYPMQDLNFVGAVLNNNTGVCSSITHAYLTANPAQQNGTALPFQCLSGYDNKIISVNLGALNLGATDYVVLEANASYSGTRLVTPPPAIGSGIVQNLIGIGHAIYNGIVYLNSAVDTFFRSVVHFFEGL